MTRSRTNQVRAFTLVEVIVSVVIAAVIAGASTSIVSNVLRSRKASESLELSMRRAQSAVDAIAADLPTVARESDLFWARVQVVSAGVGAADRDELLFVARQLRRVRGLEESPEGGDVEIAYKLLDNPEGVSELWRRADPAMDQYQDAGGVISRISSRVRFLRIEASDGESWFDQWDSDYDGYPHALRITVGATDDNGKRLTVARRVVAIDRVPLPPPEEEA